MGAAAVADPRQELTADQEQRVNETLGVLTLSGKEKLFAIDGQHRVAGIKQLC
jgi:DNA sulfur modification protein DndB